MNKKTKILIIASAIILIGLGIVGCYTYKQFQLGGNYEFLTMPGGRVSDTGELSRSLCFAKWEKFYPGNRQWRRMYS